MKWFKHDTNATTDAKLKKLILRHGAEGYAIYFHCLELIASDISESNITFELEHDSEIIADNLKIKGTPDVSPIDTVNRIMLDIVDLGLFQESQGSIFCFKLLKRLDKSMTSNSKFRDMIDLAKTENHDTVMINPDKSCKTILHKTTPEETIQDKTKLQETKLQETKPKEKPISEDAQHSAQLLYDLILINLNPSLWNKQPPNLKLWSADIEKLNRIDGIEYSLINQIITWVVKDAFWSKNIMSGKKLREKFTRLEQESKGKIVLTREQEQERLDKRRAEIDAL